MRIFFKIFLFLALLFSGEYIVGQKINFEYLTVKDGLPQSTVRTIVKDKYGFMWFGTWNGLCRYDGNKFKVYQTIPGDSTSIGNNRIHYIYKDGKGILWIATFNSFICRYNYKTDNFTRFKTNQVSQVIQDSTNRLRSLTVFKKYVNFLKLHIGPFEPSQTKEHIVFQTNANSEGGLNDNNVNCVYLDDSKILWLGTATGGVNKADLNAKKFHSFSVALKDRSAVNAPIRTILADKNGIWLGTQDDGLLFINRKTKVETYFTNELSGKNIRSIFKDSSGDIWIGNRSGLDKYDVRSKKIVNYFREKTGSSAQMNRFFAIAEDPVDHSLWFGNYNGILKYDRQTNKFEKQSLQKYFSRSAAGCLFFDSKKNLWIGTEYSGLIQLKRDPQTQKWTDTIAYKGDGINPKLPDERVYSVAEDINGDIWAGTANGLCRINPKTQKIKLYTTADGLSDQYITKVLSDRKGNVWIGHKKGLSKLNTRTNQIRNYSVRGSHQDYEFMDGSGCIEPSTGELFFGGIDGFISFSPEEIIDNLNPPKVALTDFEVLNKTVKIGEEINGEVVLSEALNLTKTITLGYEDKSFSIEFAALDFSGPSKSRYAYQLEGLDKNWIYTDASRRIATYANLSSGTYTFKVKAANSDGVWSQKPRTLKIIVLPPWWRTWWAYSLYLIVLGAIGFFLYRIFKTKQEYNHRILIESLKAEKAQELDALKSRFFTNVSHEFRTPLTLIIDPLESLLSGKLSNDKAKEYYGVMHRNAVRLLVLINQFLDFRKLESGKLTLKVFKGDIVAFLRNVMAAFEFQAEQKNIDYQLETNLTELEFGFDADGVEKILYNLISNAFKFTPEGGRIVLNLSVSVENQGYIILSVTDNGMGIPAEKLDKVFESFYQVEDNNRNDIVGSGVGLSLTKELVMLHKGTITVSSVPYKETCFTVALANLTETNSNLKSTQSIVNFQSNNNVEVVALETEENKSQSDTPIVLIVEDNDEIRNYIRMNLDGDYKVIEAENGLQGLEIALDIIPDLIISDIMMPELNGLDLCRKLKTNEKTSHIPVILLTAQQSEQYQMEGYETGADAYISKPFSSAMLLVRIKNLIESRRKLRELFNKTTGFNPLVLGTNAADKAFLSKATALIEANLSNENFDVEWLASEMFLGRTQLYRKIKALTNQSAQEFITTIRLNKAAEMLLQGKLAVGEIAFMVGYTDPTSFGRVFQKQFGLTPKKYSQQGKK
jgi:signal transduction histidine kinase/ligand-binding sensor domain-containing protein/DNA-binding response OmpR family regulator